VTAARRVRLVVGADKDGEPPGCAPGYRGMTQAITEPQSTGGRLPRHVAPWSTTDPSAKTERRSMSESLSAHTLLIAGLGGDEIQAYLARPGGDGSRGGVVVIQDLFGFDRETSEIVLTFGELG
jgi:hypothetical protein